MASKAHAISLNLNKVPYILFCDCTGGCVQDCLSKRCNNFQANSRKRVHKPKMSKNFLNTDTWDTCFLWPHTVLPKQRKYNSTSQNYCWQWTDHFHMRHNYSSSTLTYHYDQCIYSVRGKLHLTGKGKWHNRKMTHSQVSVKASYARLKQQYIFFTFTQHIAIILSGRILSNKEVNKENPPLNHWGVSVVSSAERQICATLKKKKKKVVNQ